ncbi:peptidyl-tRNA hydrolase [Suhomyces tanzawaensis NRRL Y-17324]|uniref:Peptidyl-tRNA hydrolase n=1 Tax=Suhomyces tanzawaensis NRRL Y-17324 TaxID=984487 RepID=A0A1E4SL30_9ASCO|nr:peptidyl-tRNA hydrolase [Suhomyces tanzawaensis NRRL Y-17324]ODV80209.1 peptidyl-tRNA hydrolase [Suhomyces tanzawaensis NRRL Y-17324]
MLLRNVFNSYFVPIRANTLGARRELFIASIGNPEPEYQSTRHNVGHMFFDYLTARWASHLTSNGEYYISSKYPKVVLFKSSKSFMNLQGRPISKHYRKHGTSLVIIHDELQIDLGKLQIRKPGTSARGHNGLKSINSHLPNTYTKVAIGIGRPLDKSQVLKHVLGKFSALEMDKLDEVFPRALRELEKLIESASDQQEKREDGNVSSH